MKTGMTVLFVGTLLTALSGAAAADSRINVDVFLGVPGNTNVFPPVVYYNPPPVFYTPAPWFVRHHHRGWDRDWDRNWNRHHRHWDRHHE